jgi:hypothetical protein
VIDGEIVASRCDRPPIIQSPAELRHSRILPCVLCL